MTWPQTYKGRLLIPSPLFDMVITDFTEDHQPNLPTKD